MKTFGLRLRQERKRLGLTQSALASIGGVEANAQSQYENGNRSPRAEYLRKIQRAGADMVFLLSDDEGTDLANFVDNYPNPARALISVCPSPSDSSSGNVVRHLFLQLGQNIFTAGQAIVAVAHMASPTTDSISDRRLAHQLIVLQMESERLLSVAIDKAEHRAHDS